MHAPDRLSAREAARVVVHLIGSSGQDGTRGLMITKDYLRDISIRFHFRDAFGSEWLDALQEFGWGGIDRGDYYQLHPLVPPDQLPELMPPSSMGPPWRRWRFYRELADRLQEEDRAGDAQ
jgi:hypothetical protein